MSDFENEVRSALKAGVDDDLTVGGLADGARSKLRARRRTWSGALAAAVVVAAIPVGLSVLGNDGGSGPGFTSENVDTVATGLPDGWHWESYANIEFGVPDSWQHGSPNQWCVSGDRDQAWVSRPNEAQTLVACLDPTNGYGAVIGANGTPKSPGEVWQYTQGNEYPHNAWIITVTAGGVDTLIVAPDQSTTQAIADSYRTIDAADGNGCASRQDIPRIGTAPAMTPPDSGPIVLCTYSGTATGANLAGSQALSADRARALLDALAAARTSNGMAMPDCAAIDADGTLILRGGEPLGWSFNTGCSDSGVDVGGGTVLPPIPAVLEAIYGYAPEDPANSGDGVVIENPDGSVSNDGTVVPPDTGAPDSGSGGGTSGSSGGADPGTGMEVPPASPVK
jgi:hypothetical protein